VHIERQRTDAAARRVIVAAAILTAEHPQRVLACERTAPPVVAGFWEFPGGKVEAGESDSDALVRECVEELGVRVLVGERIGPQVRLAHGRAVLRVYQARIADGGEPRPLEHAALRWLSADELYSVPWLPADAPIVAALATLLTERADDYDRS